MLHLSQQQRLLQKLTPQQVQYLKLLQLPILTLEQRIKAELEMNPLLEEGEDTEQVEEEATAEKAETDDESESPAEDDGYSLEDFMNDDLEGFKTESAQGDNEEKEELPLPSEVPFSQRLLDQLRLQDLDEEEVLLAEEIIGNI